MNDDFGANLIVLTDDEGNEHEFEHLDTLEYNDDVYMAFIPAGVPEDSDEATEIVILKVEDGEDGEDILITVDDEALLEEVYEKFMEQLDGYDEEEDQ